MKIARIQLDHVVVPLAQPYVLSRRYGTVHDIHAVIARVHTDDGLCGIGEADPMPPFTEETWGSVFAAVEHHLAPHLLGRDPRDVTLLGAELDQVLAGNLLAKGALDVALWDLLGKGLHAPIHRLLGGALQSEIPLLWPLGSGTPEEDIERIQAKMDEGYGTFMIKMGAWPIDVEIERALAIEEAFGGEIHVNVDANQGWDLAQAQRFLDGSRHCALDFVEQPLPRTERHALPLLRARSAHPLSADEGLQTLQDAADLVRENAVDVFSLKISKNGGLSRTRNLAGVAQVFGLRCLMNSMLELGVSQAAALQLGAALPNLLDCGHCFMSTLRLKDDVTDFRSHVRDAVAYLPDAPGLGIQLDEDRLKRYCVDSLEVTG